MLQAHRYYFLTLVGQLTTMAVEHLKLKYAASVKYTSDFGDLLQILKCRISG